VRDLGHYPLGVRVATALVAYPTIFASALWPTDLSVYYPHPHGFATWKIAGGAAFLVGASAGVLAAVRRAPAVAVGWCWFLGWLVPVIGLVQIGGAWRADRYTTSHSSACSSRRHGARRRWSRGGRTRGAIAALLAMAVLASWSLASQRQLAHWRDTRALFEHALAVDSTNAMAHASLGTLDEREGRYAEALAHYDAATRLSPDTWELHDERARVRRELDHEVGADH
jgi:tetratricopeptide (TPR) repeat protein